MANYSTVVLGRSTGSEGRKPRDCSFFVIGHSLGFEQEGRKPWNCQEWMIKEARLKSAFLREKSTVSRLKGELREKRYPKEEYKRRRKELNFHTKRVSEMEAKLNVITVKP